MVYSITSDTVIHQALLCRSIMFLRSLVDDPELEALHDDRHIYTPDGLDDRGCMRYSVQITGGVAPATLYHRLRNGKFVIAHDGTDCTDGGFRLLIK